MVLELKAPWPPEKYRLISLRTAESVTLVGGVELSNQSGVPEPRLVSWMPEYCVMVLYSPVVPNWLRNACRVVAYVWSAPPDPNDGPQKIKTTLGEMITQPP